MKGAGVGTTYIDPEQLEEWFSGAAAGQKLFYAFGHGLNPRHPVKLLVDDWQRTGEVAELCQKKVEGIYWYRLTRARPGSRAAADQTGRTRVSADAEWRETEAGRIYMTLVRAANLGLPCPSNAALAEAAGLLDGDAARYLFRRLQQEGRIESVLSGAGRSFRRVRIVETGRWTADEPGSA
jgi:hypothetical protein